MPAAPGVEAGQASSGGDAGPCRSPGAAASERKAHVRWSRRHSCPRSAWRRGDAQCPPATGLSQSRVAAAPAPHLHRSAALLLVEGNQGAGPPGGRWGVAGLCRVDPVGLPEAALAADPEDREELRGPGGSPHPGRGSSLTLAPQTFQIPRIGCKRPPPCSES